MGLTLNIHEYQAKELLRKFEVPTPDGQIVGTSDEALTVTKSFGGTAILKAQVHAGGRGKAGGVKFAKTPEEAKALFNSIMGMTLISPQTGPQGKIVKKVYLSNPVDIDREFYLSLLVDRKTGRVAVIASKEGGVEIEKVAHETPEKILTFTIDPALGLTGFHFRRLLALYGLDSSQMKSLKSFCTSLYELFLNSDCSLIEINPLVVTKQGALIALDAKMSIDDNSLGRHPELLAYRDIDEEVAEEIEASKYGLNFIKLDGSIGCMVNGAGLAMATMDIIHFYGSSPANFLDVGGGASEDAVKNAFRIILQDSQVKAVLVNIFGGIMRCDIVASGIVKATKEMDLKVPVVVRLEGTNVDLGKEILKKSGLNLIVADNLRDAAEKVVKAAKGNHG